MKLYFATNEIIKSDPLLCDYGSGDVTNHRKHNNCATIPILLREIFIIKLPNQSSINLPLIALNSSNN